MPFSALCPACDGSYTWMYSEVLSSANYLLPPASYTLALSQGQNAFKQALKTHLFSAVLHNRDVLCDFGITGRCSYFLYLLEVK